MDPLADMYPSLTPYSYVANNPLNHTDPTGRSIDGEYEKDKDGNWQKTSTKGDDIGVDFYHTDNTDEKGKQLTYVTDREGNWGELKNGRKLLQGQTRSNDIDMWDVFDEWKSGNGPEYSFFGSNHSSTEEFNNHYLFKAAFNAYKERGVNNREMPFGGMDLLATSTDDWMQMVGSFDYQFVQLGDKTLSVISDAKTRNSFYYKGFGLFNVTNYRRGTGNASGGNQETNTYQTYLFFRTPTSIYDKHP